MNDEPRYPMSDNRGEHELNNQDKRIYKLSDKVEVHSAALVEHGTRIEMLGKQLDIVMQTMVNRDLLNATVGTAVAKIEQLHSENVLKFEHMDTKLDIVRDNLEPIRKGIYWTAALIIASVIGGLMALLFRT